MTAIPPAPPPAESDHRRSRLLGDAAVGAALLLALLIVLLADALRDPGPPGSARSTTTIPAASPPPHQPLPLRLAVTPPEFDDIGRLLDQLGHGYAYDLLPHDAFLQPGGLDPYDVVFLTCGGAPNEWLGRRLGDSGRGAAGVYRARPQTVRALHEQLRRYVGQGGTLYVSDLHFDVLAIAFPEFVDRPAAAARGSVQTVDARVVDEGLQTHLGDRIPLQFDKPAWRPAAFQPDRVAIHLEGDYGLVGGGRASGPLMVSFTHGKGTVLFTSFHNEAQNSHVELLLLRSLVFATVTAREQHGVYQVLVRGGFSPGQRNLLALSAGEQPVSATYDCRRPGPLRFVLGFANRGAELKLTVTSPSGERDEKSGRETFILPVER
ncbi:MAG: hypothetical protein QM844_17130, partial [Planctomycetota bacterium]|nr:hypothetical protein [Planctomycetota bacterium]